VSFFPPWRWEGYSCANPNPNPDAGRWSPRPGGGGTPLFPDHRRSIHDPVIFFDCFTIKRSRGVIFSVSCTTQIFQSLAQTLVRIPRDKKTSSVWRGTPLRQPPRKTAPPLCHPMHNTNGGALCPGAVPSECRGRPEGPSAPGPRGRGTGSGDPTGSHDRFSSQTVTVMEDGYLVHTATELLSKNRESFFLARWICSQHTGITWV